MNPIPTLAAQRLTDLPPPPFPRLRALLSDTPPGKEPIDFSIGEPRHDPPAFVREILNRHFLEWRRYPPDTGTEPWREAAYGWLARRYALPMTWLTAETSILPLAGTREGLFMAVLATLTGKAGADRPAVVIPNPFYQCYAAAATAAGAEPIYLPATAETGHLPSLDQPDALWARTAGVFLCSPANPQGAVASADYWRRLLALADRFDFKIYSDECYADIYRDATPPGVLEIARGENADLERILAFHSLSKRSNLAGLRSGFVVGGRASIEQVRRLRALGGASCPVPALAAAAALWADDAHAAENRALYARKFEIADGLFTNLDNYQSPKAGFFLWTPVADGEAAAAALWREEGLRVLPGDYLSRAAGAAERSPGAGYVRVAMVDPVARVAEGLERLRSAIDRLSLSEKTAD